MTPNPKDKPEEKERLKPLSMHPLKPEEVLAAFMKVEGE
jgi:hypothetical protein